MPIQITHGYSKDRRPDLKQFVVSLITCRHLPVFIQTLSGNTSDRGHFRELAEKYSESLDKIWGEDRIWVWDSAFYSKGNLRHVPTGLRWITRVPETLKDAKEIISKVDVHTMKETSLDGYRLFSTLVNYAGLNPDMMEFFQVCESQALDPNVNRKRLTDVWRA